MATINVPFSSPQNIVATDPRQGSDARANYGSTQLVQAVGVGKQKWALLAFVNQEQSESWGVTVQSTNRQNLDPNDVLVRISWGNGGVQHQVEMSVNNGFTLNIHGSSIKVEACVNGLSVVIPLPQATVSGSISARDSGRSEPIATVFASSIAAGASLDLTLPDFTKEVLVVPNNDTVARTGIPFSVVLVSGAGAWMLNLAANEKMEWTPVQDNQIEITNDDPVNQLTAIIFCKLSI